MNYYEELAVAQDASLEEIHQAYRILARLLHPDNQADPKLRSAAECQMIRLNEILATLADPERRRRYDESICQKLVVPEPASLPQTPARPLQQYWPWGMAFCVVVAVGFWYLRSNESGEPPLPAPSLSVQQPHTDRTESAPLTRDQPLRKHSLPRKTPTVSEASPSPQAFNPGASPALSQTVDQLPAPPPAPREPGAVTGEASETATTRVQPAPVAPESSARSQPAVEERTMSVFAGHWFYAPRVHDAQTPGMYPPDFIELFLSEDQGALSGTYWARYRIPDKAVSPEVQFRVSGASAKGNTTTLGWVSDDGAKGQLQMVLRNTNSMDVSWWTSAFGRRTALTSGTALLIRQQKR